ETKLRGRTHPTHEPFQLLDQKDMLDGLEVQYEDWRQNPHLDWTQRELTMVMWWGRLMDGRWYADVDSVVPQNYVVRATSVLTARAHAKHSYIPQATERKIPAPTSVLGHPKTYRRMRGAIAAAREALREMEIS